MGQTLSILLWNVMWRHRGNPAGDRVAALIHEADADLICLTEGFIDLLPAGGDVLTSDPDFGYGVKAGRHKVILWSRSAWQETDCFGHERLPTGRFAAGTTATTLGLLRVYGLCIPWSMAGVRRAEEPLRPWEAHRAYLTGLDEVLPRVVPGDSIVLGDFNQHVPRRRAPLAVSDMLQTVIGRRMTIATQGALDGFPGPVIDHLAHGPALRMTKVQPITPIGPGGEKLSDHVGLRLELSRV
ncbi:endonuclease/exonuclease/phosphatase family protein [Ancylobacter sp. WKF20]|uniref:endonuclease/exonuclease/phosphatase family protein n=1 Tax=Ancylobacter sp. WKF20 TaxID=3039801 RepID=UPI0024343FAA|nr:endonuclease/exonuclease/phosphatase family protein [Ancylobacter sp. WKF20]WGD31972.1 endonuclease/exonuclease/phosphatase family protein [Ancylobacter sp. WKF20]